MRFHASTERACRTAKRLRDIVNDHRPDAPPVTLNAAQRALAMAWGYGTWAELALDCEAAPRSRLDEDVGDAAVAERATDHADALSRALDLDMPLARAIVAEAGLTARTPPGRTRMARDPATAGRGAGRPGKPAGTGILVGHATRTGDEAWLSGRMLRRHACVLGGAEDQASTFMFDAFLGLMSAGSGCMLVDHRGNPSRIASVRVAARKAGRADDLLVLNLAETDEDGSGKSPSNTFNPFASGGADVLTQVLVSLLGDAGSDGVAWKGRATAMLTGVMRALVFLRDCGRLDLDVNAIRDHLNLRRIIDLADDGKYPDMPASIRKSVTSYLTSLPGYQPEKGYKQAQTTLDHHGFLEMQFTRIMGLLADVYGHVTMTGHPDIDMFDVVLNRRILLVTLPELGKSWDEAAIMGRFVVASLKRMMGATLGNKIEGSWLEVVDKRMTTSSSPFVVLLNDVGHYCVDGMDLMAAQARSLGLAMVFSAQDAIGMMGMHDRVMGSVIANAATRILLDCPDARTAEAALGLAGKPYRPMSLSRVDESDRATLDGDLALDGLTGPDPSTTEGEDGSAASPGEPQDLSDGEALVFQGDLPAIRVRLAVTDATAERHDADPGDRWLLKVRAPGKA